MSSGYVPIRVQDFISGSQASSDVYVCLEGTRYVKVLHKGQSFEPARLTRYQDSKVELLYLKTDDFAKYVRDTSRIGQSLVAKGNIDPTVCVRFLNRVADAVVTELLHTDIGPETLEHVRAMSSQFLSTLQRKPMLTAILKSLEELGDDFSRHAIGVSLISTILAMKLNWMGQKTTEIIQCGGLVHDIGFRELPKELAMKARAEMTPEEVSLYESHAIRGVQLLESVTSIPSEVIAIVYEHHEHASGAGFPRGLKANATYPLARLISLADLYCHAALTSRFNPAPRVGTEVVDYLMGIHGRDFPSEYWDAIDSMVGRDSKTRKKAA